MQPALANMAKTEMFSNGLGSCTNPSSPHQINLGTKIMDIECECSCRLGDTANKSRWNTARKRIIGNINIKQTSKMYLGDCNSC